MSELRADGPCDHAASVPAEWSPGTECEDCVRAGTRWVHLRRCLGCQHVGCCDSSPMRHASAHWQATGHPVAGSAERGEHWAWCYADQAMLVPAG
ncbi:MAG TPA: UBP-type zinc finger domain-containing protein [Natronosporangium sp.]